MSHSGSRLPPLNALRAFEASARHLNFRLAAEELGVTQGAVAQHVRHLEADLGLSLFDRLPRSLAVTEQGRRYAAHLRRAFELMTEATKALRPEPLRLTISVTPTFAAKWLVPRLPEFTGCHPEVELRILASDRLADFQSDGVDIAVRYGRPPFGPDLDAALLVDQDIMAVCSPALIGQRSPLVPADLGRFILLNDSHDFWPEFSERALGVSMPPARQVRFNQTSLAIDAAVAGQGLALTHRLFVEADLAAYRLVQAFEPTLRASAGFYVVEPRKTRAPKASAIVRHWLTAAASGERLPRISASEPDRSPFQLTTTAG